MYSNCGQGHRFSACRFLGIYHSVKALAGELHHASRHVLQVDEEREAKKAELARLILAGKSLIEDEEDLFKGMSPRVSFQNCFT